jgi:hypothetical protein
MSWGAQNRSKDAKTPSASRGMSGKKKLELCGIQPHGGSPLHTPHGRPCYAKLLRRHFSPACKGPTSRSTKTRDLVFEALTEVTAGGSSYPISWWDGANRQAAPGRPHGGGRILLTCTFLRLRGRA